MPPQARRAICDKHDILLVLDEIMCVQGCRMRSSSWSRA